MKNKPLYISLGIVFLFMSIVILPSIYADNTTSITDNLIVVVQTDKYNYEVGEPIEISIYVENHEETDITVVFPTTQKADFQVNNCYLWSFGKFFTTLPTTVTIQPKEKVLLLNDSWEQVDFDGNQVSPGLFIITGWMVQTQQYPPIISEPVTIRIGSEIKIGINYGLGVTISAANVGMFNLTDIRENISITGGNLGFIHISRLYEVDNLNINQSFTKTFYPFGIGPIKIDIKVIASNAPESTLKKQLSLIFLFVYPEE